ncbi:hypothetical protein AK830_g3829 [Neonectria ditissima]|uniref:DUF3824 domain-containing protein n=1 Tax=Neonectria ditissima TaxID=78410 RepID=A0A0N8H7U7_9HYPO|nr:hypothetical protein AK830_g3829 [Neonectria ditissima]
MGDVYRDTRVYRETDRDRDSSSDDERYRSTTVRRYKVAPSSSDRYERSERLTEIDDDHRSRVSNYGRSSGDLFEPERRRSGDRPRSAFDAYAGDRSRGGYYEPERDRKGPPRDARSFVYDKEPPRETYLPPPPPPPPPPAGPRVTTYETKEVERVEDWDRRSRFDAPPFEDDVKFEKRIERRDDGDYRVEKRVEEHVDDRDGCEVERYRKETEYYSPVDPPPIPPPVIIRQRAPEPQKIIVQEAPPPPPVVIPRQDPGIVVIREKEQPRELVRRDPQEEEYYYRHERRDVGGYRGERDYAMERYDRRRHDHRDHHHYSDDEDYYVRRTVIRRREQRSESPNHKRHLAEGALAGAGITALINSRRDDYGDLPENRGRKVIAGAALGALGTEALRRAHSAYEDRWHDDDESPDRHSRLKKGLGIAAIALAAAGATKYYQSNKIEKEEAHRGRSRNRSRNRAYSDDGYSRSRSRSVRSVRSVKSTKSRKGSRRRSLSTVAKTAIGTAATASLVKHLRNKSKSQSRSRSRSRSRSKSRLRRGVELAGAAAAAGVAGKVLKNRHDKKEKEKERDYSSSDDDEYYRRRGSRSRSRSRSMARSIRSERGTDPELGLVEYGNDPLEPPRPASRGYESEAEDRRRRRRRRPNRDSSRSPSASDQDHERKRSKSRLRDMAAAGAAAIGIKEYKDKKDREKREQRSRERRAERERERERERDRDRDRDREGESSRGRDRDDRDRDRDRGHRSKSRDLDGRPYVDRDFDDRRTQSPPMASGGAYYPPYPTDSAPGPGGGGFASYPNPPNDFQPYVPQDYMGYAPPPPGGPPTSSRAPPSNFQPPPPPPPGPPPSGSRIPPDQVSESPQGLPGSREIDEGAFHRTFETASGDTEPETNSQPDGMIPEEAQSSAKSVIFIPMSPRSEMTMERHHRDQLEAAKVEEARRRAEQKTSDKEHGLVPFRPRRRRRQSTSSTSSSSSDDSNADRKLRSRDDDSSSDGTVEVLPNRFDRDGEPLEGRSATHHRWSSRRRDLEYRPPHPGDWNVRGAWQAAGTEGEMIEQLMRNVTGVLEGKKSWIGALGDVLGGLEGSRRPETIKGKGKGKVRSKDEVDEDEDDEDQRPRKGRRRRR